MTCSLLRKTSASVDVRLEIREAGGVFRAITEVGLSTGGTDTFTEYFDPPLIIKPNSDIRATTAALAGTGVAVTARIAGYLAIII
jgi:hypothetical protein